MLSRASSLSPSSQPPPPQRPRDVGISPGLAAMGRAVDAAPDPCLPSGSPLETGCTTNRGQFALALLDALPPWLPAISFFAIATTIPSTICPFLSTVVHVTAFRPWPTPLPSSTISSLRALSRRPKLRKPDFLPRHRDFLRFTRINHLRTVSPTTSLLPEGLDLIRLWYAICSNETIFTLSIGTIANPPLTILGTPSSIALSHRPIADILLIQCMQAKSLCSCQSYENVRSSLIRLNLKHPTSSTSTSLHPKSNTTASH
ncbi:hypothetical protein M422DRAFT_262321 [Sphaerobolus stellatus SS14]|uniref:Uncharacterized protein n=1 Tax=Sphaerobolus stellatus (strain SS14) TaxID=990650 RepID=A0A0C9VCW6_SPHS4|nr:hypothetical protein M422DRAFT_262321 [Sphaerobolus stellatus SS14]